MKPTIIGDVKIYTYKDLKAELTTNQYKDLMHWMRGQTCIAEGIYTYDYDRWKNGGRHHLAIESEVLQKILTK